MLRGDHPDIEVLLVHRPRHRDWSLPKGKLDPGEDAAKAAVREVEEETGVRAALGPELPDVTYPTARRTKHVRWFLMSPVSGDPAERPADEEVDVARWASIDEASELLTYDRDVEQLRRAISRGAP